VTFRLTGLDRRGPCRAHPPSMLPLSLVHPKALHILTPTAPSQFAAPNDATLLTANPLAAPRFRRSSEPLPTLRTSTSHSHSASVGPHNPWPNSWPWRPDHNWITKWPRLPGAARGQVDHEMAAEWITETWPLKSRHEHCQARCPHGCQIPLRPQLA